MEEDMNIHISNYETLKRNKDVIKSIDKDYFFEFVDCLIKGYREKEESEKYLYDAYQDVGKKMFEYAEQLGTLELKIKNKFKELKQEKDETYTKFLGSNRNNDSLSTKGKMLEGGIQVLQELIKEAQWKSLE